MQLTNLGQPSPGRSSFHRFRLIGIAMNAVQWQLGTFRKDLTVRSALDRPQSSISAHTLIFTTSSIKRKIYLLTNINYIYYGLFFV
jgi:hypothetical protein